MEERGENSTVGILLIVIVLHALHFIEELWGNAWFITSLYGNARNFLIINIALLLIPVTLLYFVWQKKQWVQRLVPIYAIAMIIDGLEHWVSWWWRGQYVDGAAGAFTGMGLIVGGAVLFKRCGKARSATQAFMPAFHFRFLTPLYDIAVRLTGFGEKFRQRVVIATPIPKTGRVLDIGCGTGTMTRLMAKRAPRAEIIGLDPDSQILAIARRKAQREKRDITYAQGTAQHLPFPDRHFSFVTSTLMFHHLKRHVKEGMLREVRRVLKPKGKFVLTDFGKPEHFILSPLAWLALWVEEGRENVRGEIPAMLKAAGFRNIQTKQRPRYNVDIWVCANS